MKETKTIKVEIKNLTDSQVIALEDLFATWVNLGKLGSSRWTAFFSDGDGNFRPSITIDGKEVKHTDLIDGKDKWKSIQVRMEPTKHNGLKEPEWGHTEEAYMIDFDAIAWKLRDDQQ